MIQTAHSKEFVYLDPRGNINLVHFRGHDNFNPIQGGLFWGCSWMGGGAGGKKAHSLKFVIISIYFNFSLGFTDCYNKHG